MKKIPLIVGLATLLFIPSALADEIGSPPTSFCELILPGLAMQTGASYASTDVDGEGSFYYTGAVAAAGDVATIGKLASDCNTEWVYQTNSGLFDQPDLLGCTGKTATNFCQIQGISVDAAGDVVFGIRYERSLQSPTTSRHICKLDATTGAVGICSEALGTGGLATVGNELPSTDGLDSIRVNDTAVAYLVTQETTGRLFRLNQDLELDWVVNIASASDVFADAQTGGIAYLKTGAVYRRVDQDDGVVLHSSAFGVTNPNSVVHASATSAFGIATTTSLSYFELNKDTFATVSTGTAVTPAKFQISAVDKNTITAKWWADAADNLLVCGVVDDGTYVFAAKIDTSTDTTVWGTMFRTSGATVTDMVERKDGCQLDHVSGFWVAGRTNSPVATLFMRHYSGGDFSQFSPPAPVTPPVAPEVFGPVDFGSGVANFAADIGFDSEPSLFFFGLVLVIIMFLVVAGATQGVTDNPIAAAIGGAIAGMGTMVFNTIQLLWPAWSTVVLIVLTSAAILFFTRGLFLGRGGGE